MHISISIKLNAVNELSKLVMGGEVYLWTPLLNELDRIIEIHINDGYEISYEDRENYSFVAAKTITLDE